MAILRFDGEPQPHSGKPFPDGCKQTSAYIGILEVFANRVFIVYDRSPFGWEAVPGDSGQRRQTYFLEVTVERV